MTNNKYDKIFRIKITLLNIVKINCDFQNKINIEKWIIQKQLDPLDKFHIKTFLIKFDKSIEKLIILVIST